MELPYQFRNRQAGESKLDSRVAWDFGMLLLDKLFGKFVPVRFIAFGIVGALGTFVHLVILAALFKGLKLDFVMSQSITTLTAMTFNFALNNVLTYRDRRLKGWKWLRGWFSFTVACSIGAVANVGVASYFFKMEVVWLFAALAGIMVGVVWNYAVTKVYTWK